MDSLFKLKLPLLIKVLPFLLFKVFINLNKQKSGGILKKYLVGRHFKDTFYGISPTMICAFTSFFESFHSLNDVSNLLSRRLWKNQRNEGFTRIPGIMRFSYLIFGPKGFHELTFNEKMQHKLTRPFYFVIKIFPGPTRFLAQVFRNFPASRTFLNFMINPKKSP